MRSKHCLKLPVLIYKDDSVTAVIFCQKVDHPGMLVDLDIRQLLYGCLQVRSDLLARDILVVKDTIRRMGSLPGKLQSAIRVSREIHAVTHQLLYDRLRRADHTVDRFLPVLVVSRLHRIFKKCVIIRWILQHADASLRQIGITLSDILLRDHKNLSVRRQMKRCKTSCYSGPYYDNVITLFHFASLSISSIGAFASLISFSGRVISESSSLSTWSSFSIVSFFIFGQICIGPAG